MLTRLVALLLSASLSVFASISISVDPAMTSVNQGGIQHFTATVTGTADTDVTWTCRGGTINRGGKWTAPMASGSYTIIATSMADPTKVATAMATVPDITLTIDPLMANVKQGETQRFAATVTGAADTGITWACSGGTISRTGKWKAPTVDGSYTITATSKADPTKIASAVATVGVRPVISAFSAAAPIITAGTSIAITGTFTGGMGSVDNGVGPLTSGVPVTVTPFTTTAYTLTVTSGSGLAATATQMITVVPVPDPTISGEARVTASTTGNLASVMDVSGSTYLWAINGGTIPGSVNTSQISYVAGQAGEVVLQCMVTNAAGAAKTGSFTASVIAPPDAAITAPSIVTEGDAKLVASVPTAVGASYAWAITGGNLTTSTTVPGVEFTATSQGTVTISCTVTNAAGTSTTGSKTMQVVARPRIVGFGAAPDTIDQGGTSSLTFSFLDGDGTIDQGVGVVSSGNTASVSPTATTTYVLVVTNAAGASTQASATITVRPLEPGSVYLREYLVRLTTGGIHWFEASIVGGGYSPGLRQQDGTSLAKLAPASWAPARILWSIQEPTGGAITSYGAYTAPMIPGTFHVVATNSEDPTKFASATVLVIAPDPRISLSVVPGEIALGPGGVQTFTAQILGTSETGVDWRVDDYGQGSLTALGNQAVFTAPAVSGVYQITAVSHADPSKSGSSNAYVNDPGAPEIGPFTASRSSLQAGESLTLTWTVANAVTVVINGQNVTGQNTLETLATTNYTLIATNANGNAYRQLTVQVAAPTIQSFTADSDRPMDGDPVSLRPIFVNGTGRIEPGIGEVTSGVPVPITPNGMTRYTLTVANAFGVSVQRELLLPVALPISLETGGDMSVAFYAHSSGGLPSIQLSDGKILTFDSGLDGNLYDPKTGRSRSLAGPIFPGNLEHPTLLMADGRVLLGGTGQYQALWHVFDPRTERSFPIPSPVSNLTGFTLTQLPDGRVLLLGGRALWDYSAAAYTINPYDLSRFQGGGLDPNALWRLLPAVMNEGRYGHQAFLLHTGKVLICGTNERPYPGGADPNADFTLELFDPETDQFTWIGGLRALLGNPAGLVLPAYGGAFALPDGRVAFMSSFMHPVARFDPSTNQVSPRQALQTMYTDRGWPVMLPNGIIETVGASDWPDEPQFFDANRNAYFVMPTWLKKDWPINDWYSFEWYFQQRPALLQDGRVFWPGLAKWDNELDDLRPGKVHLLTPAYDLSITPWQAKGNVGYPIPFKATVKDGDSVVWSASGGTIDAVNGIFVAQQPGNYRVTATTSKGRTAFASALVLPTPELILAVPALNACPSFPTQLQAYLSHTDQQLFQWQVLEGDAGGTVTAQGMYTPPIQPGTYHVRVESLIFSGLSGTITITVDPVQINLTPPYLELNPGSVFPFQGSANCGGFAWSSTGGILVNDGMYTAPILAGTYGVTATSTIDPSVSSTATVVVKPISILVSPQRIILAKNGTYRFTALVSAASVAWSATGGGSITPDGLYTAPGVDGTYTVTATSTLQPGTSATATVVVQDGGLSGGGGTGGGGSPTPVTSGVNIDPPVARVPSGTYQPFNATVFGSDDQSVDWTVTGNIINPATGQAWGTVDASGVFTAGYPGAYVVQATSKVNPQSYGTATVIVESATQRLFNAPTALNQRKAYSVTALNTGTILIAGGSDGTTVLGSCYLFDPDTKAFTETGAMNIPRSGHKTTLLSDGRVLVAQGYGDLSLVNQGFSGMGELSHAEVFDPASGTWTSLSPPQEAWQINLGGSAVALGEGKAMVFGGALSSGRSYSKANRFDGVAGFTSLDDPYLFWGQWFPALTLRDGRVFYSGGYHQEDQPPSGQTYTPDWPIKNWTQVYDPASGSVAYTGPMTSKRMSHTATVLADGRVLLVGGVVNDLSTVTGVHQWVPTATVEIYDPVAGTFTTTGSMQTPRTNQAAILLPTGQVMVVGGWSQMDADGTLWYYPTVETFDPDTGTWRVTDDLGFGLEDPKLALQQDGSVFITGIQITDAATSQAAIAGNGKLRTANKLMNATAASWTSFGWSTFFGTVSVPSSYISAAYPLNEVIQFTGGTAATPKVPTQSFISVPLPYLNGYDPSTSPVPIGINSNQRSFILRVWKPTREFKITNIDVDLTVGSTRQSVLTNQVRTGDGPTASGLFHQVDATTLPPNSTWAADWMQVVQQRADANELTRGRLEFYFVQVTFSDSLSPTQIPYGSNLVNQNFDLPPGSLISYDFKLYGATDSNAATKLQSPSFGSSQSVKTIGLWSAAQMFQNAWFGTWDNDKWCDYSTIEWLRANASHPGPQSLVGPVNDISLEHGKKGEHKNHLDGTMLDMFHPGYRSYVDADMPGSGTVFRDSHIFSDLRDARNGDPAARARLTNWINAARTNLAAIFNQLPTINGYRRDAAIYMVTDVLPSYRTIYDPPTNDSTWTWSQSNQTNATQLQRKKWVNDGNQIYQLLWRGRCDSYQIYDDQSEPSVVANGAELNLGIGETDANSFQPRFYTWRDHIHTNHLHLFLKK